MPIYECVLRQNFPNTAPAALEVVIGMRAGQGPDQIIPVAPVGPIQDRAVFDLDSGAAIIPAQHVLSRVLRAHFPNAPHQQERTISTLRP